MAKVLDETDMLRLLASSTGKPAMVMRREDSDGLPAGFLAKAEAAGLDADLSVAIEQEGQAFATFQTVAEAKRLHGEIVRLCDEEAASNEGFAIHVSTAFPDGKFLHWERAFPGAESWQLALAPGQK